MFIRLGFAIALAVSILLPPCSAPSAPRLETADRLETSRRFPEVQTLILAEAGQPMSPPSAAGEQTPAISNNVSYETVRQDLLAAGWRPLVPPDADKCWEGDRRCQGRPEMQACAGTGEGNCLFLWKKGEAVLAVYTVDSPPIISGVECRAGCR
jgi:hypothetical protein